MQTKLRRKTGLPAAEKPDRTIRQNKLYRTARKAGIHPVKDPSDPAGPNTRQPLRANAKPLTTRNKLRSSPCGLCVHATEYAALVRIWEAPARSRSVACIGLRVQGVENGDLP